MKWIRFLAWLLIVTMMLGLCACDQPSDTQNCPICGAECDANAAFCPSCGKRLQGNVLCTCGKTNEAGAKFCSACGTDLTATDNGTPNESLDNNGSNNNNEENNNNSENNNVGNVSDPAKSIWLKVQWYQNESFANQYYYNYDGVLVARRSYYRSNNKTAAIDEFSYDSHGNMILQNSTYTLSGSNLISWSYTNTYDDNGRLTTVVDNFSNKTEYKYGQNGGLTEVITSNKDGVVSERSIYENGKVKSVYNGEAILLREYTYDADGRLEKQVYYISVWEGGETPDGIAAPSVEDIGKHEGADKIYEGTVSYTYDQNGNVVSEVDYDPNTQKTTTYTYQYVSLADYRAQGLHNIRPTPEGSSSLDSSTTNGGSSSSNNNSSSSQQKCYMCGTLGAPTGKIICIGCDNGKVFVRYDEKGNEVTRACTFCSGTGYRKCDLCDGDGYR